MANHAQASPYAAAAHRGIFNLAWGLVATILSVLWTAPCAIAAAIAATMGKQHAVTVISRVWARVIIGLCGIKVQIDGLDNIADLKSFVLVTNHQSFFDIFAVIAFMPGEPRFIAKKELLRIPFSATRSTFRSRDHRPRGGRKACARRSQIIRSGLASASSPRAIALTTTGSMSSKTAPPGSRSCPGCRRCRCRSAAPGVFFPRLAKVVTPGCAMRMTIGKPIATEGMRSADRTELTRRLEEAVRATFTTEVWRASALRIAVVKSSE